MRIKTSDGLSLSNVDTMYFQSTVEATSESMCEHRERKDEKAD